MSVTVPRTCTVVTAPFPGRDRMKPGPPKRDSRPLGDFRTDEAYVLLGDPGAGKTTAFEDEAKVLGDDAHVVCARDFLELEAPLSVASDSTLFIDGLDEVRAGERNARTPFGRIRKRLVELGLPRFRLSCREADWLGENDRRHLAKVSPGGEVTVLRLDPLTESDIQEVLARRADISDPEEFVSAARNRGVDGLLANPQTLNMLADVVAGGDEWPGSRLETFEQACLRVVLEHNEEHRMSLRGDAPAPDQILDAAGRLCAVHLLTGTAGFSLLHDRDDVSYLSPDQCDYESPDVSRHALGTKLFKGQSDSRLEPIHRHIAEYVGARHLTRLVDEQRLPARRVVALVEGDDGTVVTEMRGLSAWFAAQCPAARPYLIDRDSIGVGQYGDVRGFTYHEKRTLLEALGRDVPRRDLGWGVAAGFRSLSTPDMESSFQEVLSNRRRDREQQEFVGFVLRILIDSAALPGLSDTLLRIVRDATWRSSVRVWALDAFHDKSREQDKPDVLKALLADIREGNIADPDDELRGTLLGFLYPSELSASDVWDHFIRPQNPDLFGRYRWFWELKLSQDAPDDDVAKHLDYLSRRPSGWRTGPYADDFSRMRSGLLALGIDAHGDWLVESQQIARLYDWLGVASARDRDDLGGDWDEAIGSIRAWLKARPEVQKSVILEGLKRCPDDDGFRASAFDVQERLYHSILPSDFGLWCLNRAVASVDDAPRVARHMLELALISVPDDRINRRISLERIEDSVRGNEVLESYLDLLRSPPSMPEEYEKERRRDREYVEARTRRRQEELEQLRSKETAFRENRAPPAWLYNLAKIYFGRFINFDADQGHRAIVERLRGDQSLVEAVLAGFRLTVDREDVPGSEDILALHKKGRMYYLGLPFLAGLAELERTASVDSPEWEESRIRTAVAFYYSTAHGDYEPKWYQYLVAERPETVADVQVRISASGFRADRLVSGKLWELAHDPSHAQVAKHSALRLLRGFPTRCNLKHRGSLDRLLWAAFQHSEQEVFRKLIERKLSRSSLSTWQRVHWLTAGLAVAPDLFADSLESYVRGDETRLSHLAAFFCPPQRVPDLLGRLRPTDLALLIRLLGTSVGPERLGASSGIVTSAMDTSLLVRRLVQRLASEPSSGTSLLLKTLATHDALSNWRDELLQARQSQRIIRRDEGYRHPDVEEVCRTLRGAEPATVADLAALVVGHLREIAVDIKKGSEDGWEPFWNQNPHGKGTEPKRENSCRNGIARELKLRLPGSVEISLEAHHAREKRSDLRASYLGPQNQRFHVPVEIKRSQSPDLWTSIEDQLVRKYTIDPEARGYGVFLVLWFGKECTQPSPDGGRPGSPEQLEDRLRGTLSVSQARKISVCVVDVSGGAPP